MFDKIKYALWAITTWILSVTVIMTYVIGYLVIFALPFIALACFVKYLFS